MIFRTSYNLSFTGRCMVYFITLAAVMSCKNDASGGDSSFSFFGSDEIEELGTAESIRQGLSASEEVRLTFKDSVAAFYNQRGHQPAWGDSNLRNNLVETLRNVENEGLRFEDYHGQEIEEKINNLQNLEDSELSRLDILLTDAFLTYGEHLLNGKTDPKQIHEIWDVEMENLNKIDLLQQLVEERDFETILSKLRPKNKVYRELLHSLQEYRSLKENFEGFEEIPPGEMVKHDEKDPRIPQIQDRLRFFGYLETIDSTQTANSGKFREALQKFQEEQGIEADGIIGNNTITQLNKGYDERYDQILVNLERWRWYPEDLGEHYILVNIANYKLHVIEEGDTVSVHKTMVGTEGRRTPIFSDEIEHIVFNPTWTIPPTIKTKDVIPGMRRNKNYLANRNIGVYDSNGNRVNPSRINWSGDAAKSYVYRQNPGSTNPLGRVKIMYPNEYLIYLHDTPSQGLFERNSRAESSGCVRVENVVDLSKYLLSDQQEYTSQDIDEIIKEGETKQIEMDQKVKVHHFYWTAWRENGKARFTEDIYNYDQKILEALKAAS